MEITRREMVHGSVLASIAALGSATKAYASIDRSSASGSDTLDYFDRIAAYVNARFASRLNTAVSRITSLDDLAGNTYTLIECKPKGYFILHDGSGQFAECGAEAPSP